MRLLTATRQGQGERPNDYCFVIEGELVLAQEPCATDRQNPDGGCGCGRAFVGLSSHRATTTTLVRELDFTPGDVSLAVSSYFAAGGGGPEVFGQREFTAMVEEETDLLMTMGRACDAGELVGRRLDRLVLRS